MKIAIWNEHTTRPGKQVKDQLAVQEKTGSWTVYSGSFKTLRRRAGELESAASAATGKRAEFLRTSAQTILDTLPPERGAGA